MMPENNQDQVCINCKFFKFKNLQVGICRNNQSKMYMRLVSPKKTYGMCWIPNENAGKSQGGFGSVFRRKE